MNKLARWRQARRGVQALALLLFVGLVVYSFRDAQRAFQADELLRLDPLAGLAAMLASKRWLVAFLPAGALVLATFAFGRFWCGWLCPLGTILDWSTPRRPRRVEDAASRWRGVKYGLLLVILFAALWGSLTLLFLDPLTLFVRGLSTLVIPGLAWLVTRAETLLYPVTFLRGALDALDTTLRGTLLTYKQPYYSGGLVLAVLLGGIVTANLLVRRAWCRYLCPLGGLLGMLAKVAWLKRKMGEDCTSCGACARQCRMGTIDAQKSFRSDSGECILCLDCGVTCPRGAVSFGGDWRIESGRTYDPSRRQVLGALGLSLAGVALLKAAPPAHHPQADRLRPPGADEQDLLASCIRCGACQRACPTHGLQPAVLEAGLEGFSTPILRPRLGPCDYACTACGEICPTGAIPRLTLEEKRLMVLGKAYIDTTLCIPWSGRGDCIVCEEMCPLPEKAIVLSPREVQDETGATRTLQVPSVLHEQCIGCGLCESKCPIQGEAAIRVRVDPMG